MLIIVYHTSSEDIHGLKHKIVGVLDFGIKTAYLTGLYFDKKIIRRLGPTNLGPSKIWAVENLDRLFDCSILSI